MTTEKLYDADAYLAVFDAQVLACEPTEGGYGVVLDRTAFFPEEGGQHADAGTLVYDGGRAVVSGACLQDGVIVHQTDLPIPVGKCVRGALDFCRRFRNMQHHTAEHILSGLIFSSYGYHNVGFHLGSEDVTIDLSGELDREQQAEIERRANEVVWQNLAVTARYPEEEEVATLCYRSKLALTDHVRIVTVPGVDCCACCAPHVHRTGEIGVIKILDTLRYKGGMRLHFRCGADALADYGARYHAVREISRLLSVEQGRVTAGVTRLLDAQGKLAGELAAARRSLIRSELSHTPPRANGAGLYRAVFLPFADQRVLRGAAEEWAGAVPGEAVALFGQTDGGYAYVIAGESGCTAALFAALKAMPGSGGGRGIYCGSVRADREAILAQL